MLESETRVKVEKKKKKKLGEDVGGKGGDVH